ncbi:hypothetical protein DYD21_01475 [Rhodohalobacter sp. SW132]|uniref:hypothetical protein n=1 Tax=Rhodohalobacter sp. SW132 TaxID=2293433 RepID=UPI000E25971E|nr:hypothetical protein [Rhodohalobacter sp. SW132]REL38647.1 hypothetical protein DYD21_01475 [Rhodohalobacter sp. SW132]
MDIKNISNHLNNNVNGKGPAENGSVSADKKTSANESANNVSDKVTFGSYHTSKSEELFARIELEKLNQSSFDKLKTMKSKISEYQAAKEVSDNAANETEIGKLLNNPEVWGEIADKIIG